MYAPVDAYEKSERRYVWLAYLLHLLIITAPLGILINAMKARQFQRLPTTDLRATAESVRTAYEHHVWLLYTMGVFGILLMITVGTAYSAIGLPVLIGAVGWWLYRLGKGVLSLMEHHRLPVAT